MRTLTIPLLIVVFLVTSTAPAAAQAPADQARMDKVREEARAIRLNRRVRVRLVDGSVATGRLLAADDKGVTLQPTPSDEPELYEYQRIDAVLPGPGMPRWVWVAVGAGVIVAIVGIAAAD